MAYADLTTKQRKFVDAYIGAANANATKAAIAAGYPERSAYAVGAENLRKPQIAVALTERLNELAMPASEVLSRLTEQARAQYAAFIDADGEVDLEGLEDAGLMRLVKKISWNQAGKRQVEFHDPQAALQLLGKHHKLFTERVEHTMLQRLAKEVQDMSDDELLALAGGGDPDTVSTGGSST